MHNPFRSEAEAYQFLLLTVGYFGAITLASLAINAWAGTAVFVALTLATLVWLVRRRGEGPARSEAVSSQSSEGERRILVVANETVGGGELLRCIRARSEGVREHVLVVCPALNSRLRHWASDSDTAHAAAQERLASSLARLSEAGVEARGQVGDADPVQAIEDAVRSFGPDEIIISTHPKGRSHWLEQRVVERTRERFDVDVTHVVVDLEAERGGVQ